GWVKNIVRKVGQIFLSVDTRALRASADPPTWRECGRAWLRPRASSHDSGVDAQRAALNLDVGKSRALPRKRRRSAKAREGPKCQRPKLRALVTLKACSWRLARGPMPACVRDLLEPTQRLGVEVVIADELACVEEALATVADRPLDLRKLQSDLTFA